MARKYKADREAQRGPGEGGFASIVIAMVLIVVLALMTVGFAALARREQQSALDKQLATQAYDAAESGINDAYNDIQNNYITTSTPNEGTSNCITPSNVQSTDPDGKAQTLQQDIESDHGVSYTCLMVNLTPPTLTHALSPGDSWNTVFSTTSGLSSFDVTWNSNDGQYNAPPSGTTFPPIGSATDGSQWGKAPGVLQFSITPLSSVDRTSLLSETRTYYLRPQASGAGTVSYTGTASSTIVQAKCNNVTGEGACGSATVNVSGLPSGAGLYYLVHIINYYDKSQVYLTNPQGPGGATKFSNSQVVIDVTGKARQVLKRLQVYKPLYQPDSTSSYGIEAQDICKRFSTDPVAGTVQASSGITDPDNSCSLSN